MNIHKNRQNRDFFGEPRRVAFAKIPVRRIVRQKIIIRREYIREYSVNIREYSVNISEYSSGLWESEYSVHYK